MKKVVSDKKTHGQSVQQIRQNRIFPRKEFAPSHYRQGQESSKNIG